MATLTLILVALFGGANFIWFRKLERRMRHMALKQEEAVVRLDALTARSEKVLTEVSAVKQALIDLRNAQGSDDLKPEVEAALVRAEGAMGRIDDVNDDTDPTGGGATEPTT